MKVFAWLLIALGLLDGVLWTLRWSGGFRYAHSTPEDAWRRWRDQAAYTMRSKADEAILDRIPCNWVEIEPFKTYRFEQVVDVRPLSAIHNSTVSLGAYSTIRLHGWGFTVSQSNFTADRTWVGPSIMVLGADECKEPSKTVVHPPDGASSPTGQERQRALPSVSR